MVCIQGVPKAQAACWATGIPLPPPRCRISAGAAGSTDCATSWSAAAKFVNAHAASSAVTAAEAASLAALLVPQHRKLRSAAGNSTSSTGQAAVAVEELKQVSTWPVAGH